MTTERLRIALATYQGCIGVDLRIMFCGPDGSWRPRKSGVRIRPEHLEPVLGALQVVHDHLKRGEP